MSSQNIIEEFIAHPARFGENEQIIIAFVRLYQTQPELFSDFQNSLAELCDNLPDDLAEISAKIIEWCEDKASKVYDELLKLLPEDIKAPGGRKNMNVEQAKELIDISIPKIPARQKNNQTKPSPETETSQS